MKEIILNKKTELKHIFEEMKQLLQKGEVIAFPTDTVYGIGTDIDEPQGITNIYIIKHRPVSLPLILLGANTEQLLPYVKNFSKKARKLTNNFWPGPLTIILNKSERVNPAITRLSTIGIRVPDNPFLLEFLTFYDKPLATTSANLSGYPSAYKPEDVKKQFSNSSLALLINAGETKNKVSSSIIDLTTNPPKILREGALLAADIFAFL